jgi:hypothetical protein
MNTTNTATKTELCTLLRSFINQRPRLDYCNYGNPTSYRQELRSITKQRADALQLLRAVELRDSITVDHMAEGFRAFCGRLSITSTKEGKPGLDYCSGQYWPTEYRAAACAVLASVLWGYFRANMPQPDANKTSKEHDRFRGMSAGDYLRKQARAKFGRGIVARWFN